MHPGDKVIVITYAHYDEAELASYEPLVVHVDEQNRRTIGFGDRGRARTPSAPTDDDDSPSWLARSRDRRPRPRQRRRGPVRGDPRRATAGLSVVVLTKGELG